MTSRSEADRTLALRIIGEQVEVRFGLSRDAFADCVLAMRCVEGSSGAALAEQVGRLALDDLYLAAACARGDERAWREFQDRYFAFIRDFARRVHGRGSPDDVAAQVVADLWQRQKLAQFEGRSTLRTWLGTLIIRTALNAAAGADRHVSLEEGNVGELAVPLGREAEQPGEREDAQLLARLLARAIERLPAEDKLLLFLYYEQRLTLEEIAPALRASKATLSRRLSRVRTRLREAVQALLQTETGHPSIDRLRAGLAHAGLEFDLSAALGDCVRLLEGNRRGGV